MLGGSSHIFQFFAPLSELIDIVGEFFRNLKKRTNSRKERRNYPLCTKKDLVYPRSLIFYIVCLFHESLVSSLIAFHGYLYGFTYLCIRPIDVCSIFAHTVRFIKLPYLATTPNCVCRFRLFRSNLLFSSTRIQLLNIVVPSTYQVRNIQLAKNILRCLLRAFSLPRAFHTAPFGEPH